VLIAAAHVHGIPIVVVSRGMRWRSDDGVSIDILAPQTLSTLSDAGATIDRTDLCGAITAEKLVCGAGILIAFT
jgi:hypothetical protein